MNIQTFLSAIIENNGVARHIITILLILPGAFILHRFLHVFIERLVRRTVIPSESISPEAERKREDTLIGVFHTTMKILLIIIVTLMILSELGLNIAPMLAAAGVAGIAFGFGGQYLIRDVISGLFIILENQFRIGDVVTINRDTSGLVEGITLRLTTLRDLDGTVHQIPNGEIRQSANLTKVYSRVHLNIGVSYDSDIEHVERVVNRVGQELADDPRWKPFILRAPQFLRVDDFADSAVMIKILGDTAPLKQWDIMGEFRKRLFITFKKEDIKIPFPQRVVTMKKD